jgi:hypothetical protein
MNEGNEEHESCQIDADVIVSFPLDIYAHQNKDLFKGFSMIYPTLIHDTSIAVVLHSVLSTLSREWLTRMSSGRKPSVPQFIFSERM